MPCAARGKGVGQGNRKLVISASGGDMGRGEPREGTPLHPPRHAFEADIAGDGAIKVENAIRSELVLTASKAWHPASLPCSRYGFR